MAGKLISARSWPITRKGRISRTFCYVHRVSAWPTFPAKQALERNLVYNPLSLSCTPTHHARTVPFFYDQFARAVSQRQSHVFLRRRDLRARYRGPWVATPLSDPVLLASYTSSAC